MSDPRKPTRPEGDAGANWAICRECGREGAGLKAIRHRKSCRFFQAARDPRKDPMPGDLLKDSRGQLYRVRALGPGETRDIGLWRKAMRGATVIERAGA